MNLWSLKEVVKDQFNKPYTHKLERNTDMIVRNSRSTSIAPTEETGQVSKERIKQMIKLNL